MPAVSSPSSLVNSFRNESQPRHKVLNRTSVGLVTAFLLCFGVFLVLTLKGHRQARQARQARLSAQAQAATTRRHIGRDRPKLWEVSLENCASLRPGRAVSDWQASHPNIRDVPKTIILKRGTLSSPPPRLL